MWKILTAQIRVEMSLNHILRKCNYGYKFTKSQEKIKLLMYMDGIKLFAKTEKKLETDTNNKNI